MPEASDSGVLHQAMIWIGRDVPDEKVAINARELAILCYLLAVADSGIPVRLQEFGQPAFGRVLKALRGKL